MPTARMWLIILFLILRQEMIVSQSVERIDSVWSLYYLVGAPTDEIRGELRKRESQAIVSAEDNLALAVLNLNLCMLQWQDSYADKGHRYLTQVAAYPEQPELLTVYRGIDHSFQGRKKTFLGMHDLKAADNYFQAIPADLPDWMIRFLRGITLYELGVNLPGLWLLKDFKARALELGSQDLAYVLLWSQANSALHFNWQQYDRQKKPVPLVVKQKIAEVMAD